MPVKIVKIIGIMRNGVLDHKYDVWNKRYRLTMTVWASTPEEAVKKSGWFEDCEVTQKILSTWDYSHEKKENLIHSDD